MSERNPSDTSNENPFKGQSSFELRDLAIILSTSSSYDSRGIRNDLKVLEIANELHARVEALSEDTTEWTDARLARDTVSFIIDRSLNELTNGRFKPGA